MDKLLEVSQGDAAPSLPLSRYRIDYTVPEDSLLFKVGFRIFEDCFGARWVTRISKKAHENRLPGEDIWSAYVRFQGVKVESRGFDIARIPKTGPLVIVANHPTGMSDSQFIASAVERNIRPDAKFLSVPRFCELPGVKDRLIPVYLPSPSGRTYRDAERLIAEAREAARQHVESGGAMIIFPCGPGATWTPDGEMQDGPWRHGAFALAAQTGAKVVPVFIDAPMMPLRNRLYRIHPILFHAAAPMGARYLRGKTVTLTFGDPDSAELKEALSDLSTAPEKVRELVYRLAESS